MSEPEMRPAPAVPGEPRRAPGATLGRVLLLLGIVMASYFLLSGPLALAVQEGYIPEEVLFIYYPVFWLHVHGGAPGRMIASAFLYYVHLWDVAS